MTDDETGLGTVGDPPAAHSPSTERPLVEVTFQNNPHQKKKFLESEPKALGITQIALSVYYIGSIVVLWVNDMTWGFREVLQIFVSLLVIIAGSLAIAAQNLRLPTLKAGLGIQVGACVGSVFILFCAADGFDLDHVGPKCRRSLLDIIFARLFWYKRHHHATLASYCCKVVNCCFSASTLPVITVQASPAQ
ncbi:hypothetical protein DPEC_G00272500 [Dallia pectoralis]|uniref:Uncharacterized protein n=1 Tax=Dallia pectoralis TaxID=75939 RepID=A0ACC2FPU2_DALPE|nr:hypothetical protein DPEC_G00272500 [Dallia pectoralis]